MSYGEREVYNARNDWQNGKMQRSLGLGIEPLRT